MAKILIADHQRSVRSALTDCLKGWGHEVKEAANGRDALKAVIPEKPDLILLDVTMPGMDGWQVLTELKGNPQTKGIPVVMLASFPSIEIETDGMRLGAAHVLGKPWQPETLKTLVKVSLREAQIAPPRTAQNVTGEDRLDPEVPDEGAVRKAASSASRKWIGTGGAVPSLERLLSGGIPLEALTLIEGAQGVGKSVICQYFTYGAILEGRNVAYFTLEHTWDSLIQQMASFGLKMARDLDKDQLCIYPMQ